MFSARIRGADAARKAARDLRRIHDRTLTREIRSAVKGTVDDKLPPLLRASALAHTPARYGKVLSPAMRVKTTTKLATTRGVGVQVTIWAQGKTEHRDVESINAGRLRHPLFGMRKRWYTTTVPRGFVDRPITALRRVLVRDVDQALSRVADKFNVGR